MTVALDERGCAVLTRTHADVAFLDGKRARIDEPHVAALNALVQIWREPSTNVDNRRAVPWFDPE